MEDNSEKKAWEKMKTANVLGVTIIVFVVIVSLLLFFWEVPEGNKDLLDRWLFFTAGMLLAGVVAYFFNYKKNEQSQYHIEQQNENCTMCGKPFEKLDQ